VVLATKVGLVVGPSGGYPLLRDARPERILEEIDGSLRRLRTDAIDLYYLHRVDEQVPLEDTWGAMSTLVQAGKVRALGLSEVDVSELERAHAIPGTKRMTYLEETSAPQRFTSPPTTSPSSRPSRRRSAPGTEGRLHLGRHPQRSWVASTG
jgi:aryl-alcohol dehydrogenase-like predicted oxidoreductase